MYFNKKTVHTCTNSSGRGSKDYVGCHYQVGFHCKGNNCHCHCHLVGCHNKVKHCHQVGCHHSKFGRVSSLSGGGVIAPVGSLVCGTDCILEVTVGSHVVEEANSMTSCRPLWPPRPFL